MNNPNTQTSTNNNTQTESCCSDSSCCGGSTPFDNADLPKIGRNDPCFCGSGKKFKKCCGK